MSKRMKFNPVVSKIKLNPEQAVLTCTCVTGRYSLTSRNTRATICSAASVRTTVTRYCTASNTANWT